MGRKREGQLIVALDVDSIESAGYLVRRLLPYTGYFKIGLEMMTAVGCPKAINYLQSYGAKDIFLDAKYHDIPNTVGKSVKAASGLGVAMISVHASSDNCESLKAAADNKNDALICAVIRLTSSESSLDNKKYYSGKTDQDVFLNRIFQAKKSGVDGIICPASYLKIVNQHKEFDDLLRVTPGIRLQGETVNDHKECATPIQAIKNGSDFLVVGRPITNPSKKIGSSEKAIRMMIKEMNSVRSKKVK